MATIGSIYSKSASNIGGIFSKVKEYYFSMSVATITNALRNAKLPNGAKITKIEIEPHIEIENSVAGNFFFSYGFGSNNSSIGTTLINGAQITKVAMSGSIKPKANITSYMSSLQAPYACSTAYGSYFNFKVHADTIGKRSYWLRSVYLYVTYEVWHTAKFKNGETVLQTISVKSGSTPSYTGATPTKEQTTQSVYTFSGWNPAIGAITADTTYMAQFTESPRPYWVSGGSRGNDCETRGSQYYNYGDIITLEAYNFAEHKEFHYWRNTLGELTFEAYSNPLIVTLNEELLERCPLSSTGSIHFDCCTRGKIYTLKAEVLPDSAMGSVYFSTIFVFDGENLWGDNVEVIVPNEGVTYRYGETEYSLGFKAVPNEGYKFVKWSDGVTDNPRIIADGNYTYTAIFEEILYNLTYDTELYENEEKWGIISGPSPGKYKSGTKLDFSIEIINDATYEYKYYFGYWIVNGGNFVNESEYDNPVAIELTGNCHVTATWERSLKKNFNFSVKVEDETMGYTTGATSGNYKEGTELTFTAIPKEGHKFIEWSDGDTNPTKTIILDSETTYIAIFEKKKAVVYYTEPHERYGQFILTNKMGEEISGQYGFSYGEELTLTFIPERSYKFTNFTIEVITENNPLSISSGEHLENPLTFSIVEEGTVDITVNFRNKKYYYLTLSNINVHKINNEIANELLSGGQFLEDDVLELLPELPTPLYKFIQWSGDISGTEVPKVYTVTKDATLRAELKELQMKFKSVKILHHSTNEVASPTNPLTGGEDGDQAIIKVQIALE